MIPTTIQSTRDDFSSELLCYSQSKFTGRLDITISTKKQWSLYLHLGRLVWATGGRHSVRRWQRYLVRYCPGINPHRLTLRQDDRPECWDYHALWLLALRKIPSPEQIRAILQSIIGEVLFDLIRAIAIASVRQTSDRLSQTPLFDFESEDSSRSHFQIEPQQGVRPSHSGMLPQTSMMSVAVALDRAQNKWQNWVAAGLTHCSPDMTPVLTEVSMLEEKTPSKVYRNLVATVNGQRSLRDLAALMNKDVLVLTRSLVPYLRQQLIKLVAISDLPRPNFNSSLSLRKKPPIPTTALSDRPLIVGIDDNAKVLADMEEILGQTGCRFLAIPDPLQALPMLLQYKPDLIFLDLAMPIANGYEICAQIRRVSQFQSIPVIILTGNDGIIDRMRSKVVGATDFLSKPVELHKVLSILDKYCAIKAA